MDSRHAIKTDLPTRRAWATLHAVLCLLLCQASADGVAEERGEATRPLATEGHAEVARRLSTEGCAEIARLLAARASLGEQSAQEREHCRAAILQAAKRIEALGSHASEPMLRRVLWAEAIWGYFSAAVPLESDPANDPLRRQPGPGWSDFVRLGWELIGETPGGIERPEVARHLYPVAAFDGEVHRVGAVYGEAYWQPALAVMRRSSNPIVRAQAGAFAAERCMLADWSLACDLWREVRRIIRDAEQNGEGGEQEPHGTTHARERRQTAGERQLRRTADALAAAFTEELWRCARDLQRALVLAIESTGRPPDTSTLRSAERLWKELRPHLGAAIRQGPWTWRDPTAMDLASNRLTSLPGLRVRELHWAEGDTDRAQGETGSKSPLLRLEIVLQDD